MALLTFNTPAPAPLWCAHSLLSYSDSGGEILSVHGALRTSPVFSQSAYADHA